MMVRLTLAIVLFTMVAGCERLNVSNWFSGGSRNAPAPRVVVANDPRPLVDQVVQVQLERAPGGRILRAVGLTATQGHWAAGLVYDPTRSVGGRQVYLFRLFPPPQPTRVSSEASREVVVARFLSEQQLFGVREIQVLGTRASRSIRP